MNDIVLILLLTTGITVMVYYAYKYRAK